MMKFTDFVKRMQDRRFADGVDQFMRGGDLDLDYIAMLAVQELGMHVGTDGLVHDPKPSAVAYNEQHHTRWSGSKRRR